MARFPTINRSFIPLVNCCYFFDDMHGIVGIDGINGIFITYDGGTTWTQSLIPQGYSGLVNDIFMTDLLHGWAAVDDPSDFSRCLWKTVDGGLTWTEVLTSGPEYTSVYQTPTTVLMTSRYTGPPISISTNAGFTFGGGGLDSYNDLDFVDDVHGVASGFHSGGGYGNAMWTDNAGLTWYTNNLYMECWGVHAKKGTSTFFAAGEGQITDNTISEKAWRSDNFGRNWRVVGTVPDRTTGDIQGVGDVLYVQTWTRNQFPSRYVGLLRSTDGGVNWKPVGGPSNYRDCRFWVGNCHGRTIIAFDEDGGVWRSDDGGDGLITDGLRNPYLLPSEVELTADKCTTADGISALLQMSCKSLIIEDISFVDSTDEAITTGALQIASMPPPGTLLEFGKLDTIKFSWDPSKLAGPKAKTSILLRVHCLAEDSSAEFDTLISVNVTSKGDYPLYSLSRSMISLDSLNICNALVDTIIDVANHGCDTLFLDQASITGSSGWVILSTDGTPLLLPQVIPIDSIGHFLVRFRPTSSGKSSAAVELRLSQSGASKDTSISLSGITYRTLSVSADLNLRFPPTSVCVTRDTVVQFKNTSCDTLVIDSLISSDPAMYDLYSGLTPPIRLAPDSVLLVPVRYHPQRNVGSLGTIGYAYHVQNDSGKTITFIVGLGISGTSVFSTTVPSSTVTFADRTDCQAGDSTKIHISNIGCDSMRIVSASLSGATSGPFSYRFSSPLPIGLIGNGNGVGLEVVLDSAGAGTNDGLLTIRYASADGSLHDTIFHLSARVVASPHIASLNKSAVNLGTHPFCSYALDTAYIRNDGCSPITVSSIAASGQDFVVFKARSTPFDIAAGGYDSVIVALSPTIIGPHAGTLAVLTNADVKPEKSIDYIADVRPVDVVTFRLEMANPNINPGDTAQIDVLPNIDWPGKGLKEVSFAITYNSNLLGYTPNTLSYDPNNSVLTTAVAIPNQREQVNVQVTGSPEIVLQKDQPIASFYLRSYLTDTLSTPISLSLLEINKGDVEYGRCVLQSLSVSSVATLEFACGDKLLQEYMLTKQILIAGAPHPDPAPSSTIITFPFQVAEPGIVVLSVFDEFGRKVFRESMVASSGKALELHAGGDALISGAYSYDLSFEGKSKATVRGRFVILK